MGTQTMKDLFERFIHYIKYHPEVVARASYTSTLMLLFVVGVLFANLSYYKDVNQKLNVIAKTQIEANLILTAKVKVLETNFYKVGENYSIYEKGIAKDYNDNLASLDRIEGKRKNIMFINYLSYVKLDQDYVRKIAGAFYDAGVKYNIDSRELIATAWHESRFRPKSKSSMGARGVMQVMPLWLKNEDFVGSVDVYSREDLLDPVKSIQAGAYIYDHYRAYWKGRGYKKDHNVRRLALLSYNRGHGRVSRLMRDGINPANGYFKVVNYKYSKLIKFEKTMI